MRKPHVLMIGTGEYTTGYVHDRASGSDKSAGVVALTLFDLRRRGLVGELSMAGTRGSKFPGIRRHLQAVIADQYRGLDVRLETFPADDVEHDPTAYLAAMDKLEPGDAVTIFTPDDQHFPMALAAVQRGLHVLVAKPLVKTLDEHRRLAEAAREKNVLVAVEVHKRWDPMYADARDRIAKLGDFSYFNAYMSQPKSQLDARSVRIQGIARNLRRANGIASAAQRQVDQANAVAAAGNQRILAALKATTGMNHGDNVEAWWNAWQTYNDVYSEQTPIYEESYASVEFISPPGACECFVAGTPVWTKAGPKPIEQIVAGDQVLAQDPVSGELAYRFVLETTVRPSTQVYRLTFNGEEIDATRGHRFWVNGAGWRMVGFLKPAAALHTMDDSVTLADVEPLREREVYNLVVDEFHTYFVGRNKLLVHDSHCPKPAPHLLPGVPRRLEKKLRNP